MDSPVAPALHINASPTAAPTVPPKAPMTALAATGIPAIPDKTNEII